MLFLKMFGLTVLGILGATAVFAALVMGVVDAPGDPPSPSLLVLIGGVGTLVAIACTWGIVALNRRWKRDFSLSFEAEPDRLLAHWGVAAEQWAMFSTNEHERGRRDLVWIGIGAGGLAGLTILGGSWKAAGPMGALLWGALVAIGIALLTLLIGRWLVSRRLRGRQKHHEALVWIRDDGMRINDRLIAWNQFGARRESMRLDIEAGDDHYDVLEVTVSVPARHGRVRHEHRVAAPVELREQLVQFCRQNPG